MELRMNFILKLLFAFLIATAPVAAHELAICAIFKDEAAYLREWMEFHKLQGVEHFILYNHNSSDNYAEVLAPYIARGEVTLKQWPYTFKYGDHDAWMKVQSGAYMDCISEHRDDIEWLAVIDIDEFLFCVDGQKLPDFLKSYRDYPALCVNWVKFGTSHVEDLEPNKLLIEVLTSCIRPDPEKGENRFVKSIIQPRYVKGCTCPHVFEFHGEKQVLILASTQSQVPILSAPS